MDMVRHDNELVKLVTLAVKMPQRVLDDRLGLDISKDAGTVALIKPVLETLGESLIVLGALLRRSRRRVRLSQSSRSASHCRSRS